ncbi:MAG: hypothetical protein ACJAT4_001552 [Granulosicoccus sp.]|jgi:hypothetical protein
MSNNAQEGWIKPRDYIYAENLFYAVDRICANIGKNLKLNFSQYSFKPILNSD